MRQLVKGGSSTKFTGTQPQDGNLAEGFYDWTVREHERLESQSRIHSLILSMLSSSKDRRTAVFLAAAQLILDPTQAVICSQLRAKALLSNPTPELKLRPPKEHRA